MRSGFPGHPVSKIPMFLKVGPGKAMDNIPQAQSFFSMRQDASLRRLWLRLAGRLEEGEEALVLRHADNYRITA
jgi:hypothetical protein